jgi:protein required for attachment to host cells
LTLADCDGDGDKKVTLGEFRKALDTPAVSAKLMKTLDKNNDGVAVDEI